jgi:hypothetical protein
MCVCVRVDARRSLWGDFETRTSCRAKLPNVLNAKGVAWSSSENLASGLQSAMKKLMRNAFCKFKVQRAQDASISSYRYGTSIKDMQPLFGDAWSIDHKQRTKWVEYMQTKLSPFCVIAVFLVFILPSSLCRAILCSKPRPESNGGPSKLQWTSMNSHP